MSIAELRREYHRCVCKEITRLHKDGEAEYPNQTPISDFDQYEHLANLERIIEQDNELASALGKDYIIKPDIVISRWPVLDNVKSHSSLSSVQP